MNLAWNEQGSPVGISIDQLLYRIRKDDGNDGLIFDSVTLDDILAEDGVEQFVFDAMVTPFSRLRRKMEQMLKVMNRAVEGLDVTAMQVSDPFRRNGVAQVAAVFELSDGQTVSVYFHNPDSTPAKLTPTDDMVSWKWLLNKKDITIVVAPEKGKDLAVREVSRRIMRLAERNGPAFARQNAQRAERLARIQGLKDEIDELEQTLEQRQQALELARVEAESRALAEKEASAEEGMAALNSIKRFLSRSQYRTIAAAMKGEEKRFFIDKARLLADIINGMAETYEQDGKGMDATSYLHYFKGGADWYITEKDSQGGTQQAFGWANLGHGGELGYISIDELTQNNAELDLHFDPQPLNGVVKASDNERNEQSEGNIERTETSLDTYNNWVRSNPEVSSQSGWKVIPDPIRGQAVLMRKHKEKNEAGGGYVTAEMVSGFADTDKAKSWAKDNPASKQGRPGGESDNDADNAPMNDAIAMVETVTGEFDGSLSDWERDESFSGGAWSFTNLAFGGVTVRAGVSYGGVVSLDGKPHDPEGRVIDSADSLRAAIVAMLPKDEEQQQTWKASTESVRELNDDQFASALSELEADNLRSEAVLLLARRKGTDKQIAAAERILQEYNEAGHASAELIARRDALRNAIDQGEPDSPQEPDPAIFTPGDEVEWRNDNGTLTGTYRGSIDDLTAVIMVGGMQMSAPAAELFPVSSQPEPDSAAERSEDEGQGNQEIKSVIESAEFKSVTTDFVGSMAAIKGIDEGAMPGMERSLFVNSITGKIKTRAKNNPLLASALLAWLSVAQEDWSKPAVTARNSVWKAADDWEQYRSLFKADKADPEQALQQAREQTDTDPTDEQKDDGDYQKGELSAFGLDLAIENPKGHVRSGKSESGDEWSVSMAHDYGYIKGTKGLDGDEVDVFIGPNLESEKAFVIEQVDPSGKLDEHKVMLGFDDEESAKQGYLSSYKAGWDGLGSIREMNLAALKAWLPNAANAQESKPNADQSTTSEPPVNQESEPTPEASPEQGVTPFADWRGDLLKTRDYANQLREAGRLNDAAVLEAWKDADALAQLIDAELNGEPAVNDDPVTEPEGTPAEADTAFLQSVIDGTVPDILAPELGDEIAAVLERHVDNTDMEALLEQAVMAYQTAMLNATANIE